MFMRLRPNEIDTIRKEVRRFDAKAEIYVFGSRIDDSARGGDIDLLIVSDSLGFRDLLRVRMAILDSIGWQQLDLIIRNHDELDEPFVAMALETGTKL